MISNAKIPDNYKSYSPVKHIVKLSDLVEGRISESVKSRVVAEPITTDVQMFPHKFDYYRVLEHNGNVYLILSNDLFLLENIQY